MPNTSFRPQSRRAPLFFPPVRCGLQTLSTVHTMHDKAGNSRWRRTARYNAHFFCALQKYDMFESCSHGCLCHVSVGLWAPRLFLDLP